MQGSLTDFKPHHRLTAARELLRRGFDPAPTEPQPAPRHDPTGSAGVKPHPFGLPRTPIRRPRPLLSNTITARPKTTRSASTPTAKGNTNAIAMAIKPSTTYSGRKRPFAQPLGDCPRKTLFAIRLTHSEYIRRPCNANRTIAQCALCTSLVSENTQTHS